MEVVSESRAISEMIFSLSSDLLQGPQDRQCQTFAPHWTDRVGLLTPCPLERNRASCPKTPKNPEFALDLSVGPAVSPSQLEPSPRVCAGADSIRSLTPKGKDTHLLVLGILFYFGVRARCPKRQRRMACSDKSAKPEHSTTKP